MGVEKSYSYRYHYFILVPLKHAKKLKNSHNRYSYFMDYDDAKDYKGNFTKIRNFKEPLEYSL